MVGTQQHANDLYLLDDETRELKHCTVNSLEKHRDLHIEDQEGTVRLVGPEWKQLPFANFPHKCHEAKLHFRPR